TCSSSETSNCRGTRSADSMSRRIASASRSSPCPLMSHIATRAPRAAKRRAQAAPMPEAAPVTRARRSSKSRSLIDFLLLSQNVHDVHDRFAPELRQSRFRAPGGVRSQDGVGSVDDGVARVERFLFEHVEAGSAERS